MLSGHSVPYWLACGVVAALVMANEASADEAAGGSWRFTDHIELFELDADPGRFEGQALYFRDEAVEAPMPFGCEDATYEMLSVPPQGLFQGHFAEEDPAAVAERFGLPLEIETVRVACSTGSFDYHIADDRMLTMLDGVVHVLERQDEE